jgi:hypothetical protein
MSTPQTFVIDDTGAKAIATFPQHDSWMPRVVPQMPSTSAEYCGVLGERVKFFPKQDEQVSDGRTNE